MKSLLLGILLLVSASCLAETYPALVPMPKEYLSEPGEVIEVKNIPEARSQGGLPVCYGISAWYAYMQFQCKKGDSDCQHLNPDKTPSPIMIGALGVDKELHEKYGRTYNKIIPYSVGGGDSNALSNLSGEDEVWADSCFPFDKLIQKFGGDNRKMYNAFENLRIQYFEKNKAEGGLCMTCLLDILRNDFGLSVTETTAKAALNENVFDKFLFDLFVKDCKKKVQIGDFKQSHWPLLGETRTYDSFIAKLIGLFKKNTPVLAGICLNQKGVDSVQCKSGHSLTITGYRKICSKGADCTEYLKVLNTWGEAWQKQNSDGWMDAKTLCEYMYKNAMTWIEAGQ